MSIILPNENERRSRLDDILYALCTLSLLDEYDVPNEDRINEYYKALLTGDLSELTFMPKSRIEKLLHFLTIGTNEGIEAPKSRIEYLLYVLAGLMQVSALPFNVNERSSRHEKYLMYLIENGGVGVKSLTVSFFNNQEILNSEEGNVENLTFKGNTILPVIKKSIARNDAFELTNLKSNNTYTVQTNEKEFTLNGVTYPEIETSATTTASVDRVISIDDIYTRVDNVEKMVLEGMNYGNLLQESGQDEFVSHASDENQTITINDTVEGRLKDLTLKGDTLVNILPSESTLRNEMTNSYSQKLNNDYDEVIVVDGEYKDLNVEGRTLLNLASVQNDSETNFYVVGEEINGQSIEIEQENFDYSVPRNLKDVTLEGSTYISKTASLINSMDNISMQKLNEGYDEVNVVDGEFESAILKGMTLVNLATHERFHNGTLTYGEYLIQPLKNNTKYLLVFDNIENVEEVSLTTIDWITHQSLMSGGTLKTKCVFTLNVSSPSIITNIRVLLATTPTQTPDYKIMLIEYQEGMENWDLPYFEGMTNVKMPVLTTTGKNLFNARTVTKGYTLSASAGLEAISPKRYISDFIYVKGLTHLAIRNPERTQNVWGYDEDKQPIIKIHNGGINGNFIISIPSNVTYVRIPFSTINQDVITDEIVQNNLVQVEAGKQFSSYEPYKTNILTCDEEVALCAIGNVKDELNLLTGELTQKIGELTIDAYNTNISLHEFYDNTVALKISTDMTSTGEKQIICDSLPTITLEDMSNGSIGVATSTTDGDSYIYVSIPTDGLTTTTIQDICAYFTTSPINIKYPLTTKVVSEVNLSVTDQDDMTLESPLAYNSGKITLSSDSILPSLDYEVQSLNSFSNLKPNTTYTFKKNGKDFNSTYKIDDITYTTSNTLTTTGNNEVVVLTSTISDTDKVALIEGNNVGIDILYFEGMGSVKQPVLTVTGKNLFDGEMVQGYIGDSSGNLNAGSTDGISSANFTPVKPNTTYRLSLSSNPANGIIFLYFYDKYKKYVGRTVESTTVFTTDNDVAYVKFRIYSVNGVFLNDYENVQFQIEEGSNKTSYEPYKSTTLTCNEEVTLRGIGDVKDELNLLTGELTERIGEIVLDGNENWVNATVSNDLGYKRHSITITSESEKNNSATTTFIEAINDRLFQRTFEHHGDYEYLFVQRTDVGIKIYINSTKWSSVSEFKSYLSRNPITIYYQSKSESIKTVDLSIVDQDNISQSNLQLQTQLSHITTSSDTLIPIFNISATNNYDVQIKPSTQYTVRLSQDVVGDQLSVDLGGAIQTVTSNEFTITTPSTLAHEQLRIGGEGNVIGEIQLFEGNATGLVNEYFDGMKVSKISILTTTGKNLLNEQDFKADGWIAPVYENGKLTFTPTDSTRSSAYFRVNLEKGKQYVLSFHNMTGNANGISNNIVIYTLSNTDTKLSTIKNETPFTWNYETGNYYIRPYSEYTTANTVSLNIQLEEGSTVTTYEPYKSNVLSTGEEVVLRSLPNGVCDTLNLVTGEYVQRVGKIVLDGSENWYLNTTKTNTQVFRLTMSDIATTQNNLYCETMRVASGIDAEIIATNGGGLFIGLLKTKASTVEKFKAYLSQNPITVQYELATPIITQISPTITDQDENAINAPLSYKNGHIQVTTSEIAPIVNYEIPTSNSYHLDLAVNGGAYTVKGDNTNELITHNSEPLISDDTHLMVIEGDCVSKDVPYFEGMTSVQTPKLIISNCSNINCEEYKYTTVETDVLDGIVLRAIGNVKDELNLVTGELTQRISEIVLDGSENWQIREFNTTNTECVLFSININDKLNGYYYNCDKFKIANTDALKVNNVEGIHSGGTPANLFINVSKAKASTVEDFKNWLSNNNTTVQYQLAEPIITTIDLTKINQDDEELNYISSYDTITHFEASSESLFPTVSISPVSYPVTLKTNTTYTLMFNKVETSNNPLVVNLGGTQIQLTNGEDIITITTPNTLANQNITWYGTGHKVSEIMVLEGNIEKLPYFEGSIPSRISTLTTVHDNGIRENTLTFNEEIILRSNNTTKDTLDLLTGQLIRYFDTNGNLLETPTTETVTYTVYNNGASDDVLALIPDDNIIFDSAICPRLSYEFDVIRERLFSYNTISSKELYTKDENFTIVYGDHRGEVLPQLDEMTSCINPSITFSDGSNSNTHEIEGTFRSVGTKFDKVDVINGTATINFGTFTLDGTENWVFLGSNTNTTGAYVRDYLVDAPTTNNVLSTCSIGCGNASDSLSDEEGVYLNGFNRYVYVRINNDKLQSQDVAGIVAYLNENSIEVIYQLANPITMNINVTSDGAMVSYEDVTYVSLTSDSGVLPHETTVRVAAKTREVVDEVSTLSLRQNETEEQIEEQSDENLISMIATTEIYENLL